jgi:glucose/arabinose dehydrogenase
VRLLPAALALWLATVSGAAQGAGSTRILAGLGEPLFVAAPFGDARLFVVERTGRIRLFEDGALQDYPFLDLSGRVDLTDEGGLLGLAFAPDFAESRAFYVYYTVVGPDAGHPQTARLSRFRAAEETPNLADPTEKILLALDLPTTIHHGGTVAFGRDRFLYLALGDGGVGAWAQDRSRLFGKLLRLDVSFSDFEDDYAIPPDNPFADEPPLRGEIWALGFRNPFRFGFDRLTGDLYLGDVGDREREEIDVERRPGAIGSAGGRNYGWDVMEGSLCHASPGPGVPPCNAPSLVLPVHEYAHGSRCAVSGGTVYRGASLPTLRGHYLFADYCTGEVFSLRWDGAGGTVGPVLDRTAELAPDHGSIDQPVGFGEGGTGEVYLVDQDGDVFWLAPEPSAPLRLVAGAAVLLAARRAARRTPRPAPPPM